MTENGIDVFVTDQRTAGLYPLAISVRLQVHGDQWERAAELLRSLPGPPKDSGDAPREAGPSPTLASDAFSPWEPLLLFLIGILPRIWANLPRFLIGFEGDSPIRLAALSVCDLATIAIALALLRRRGLGFSSLGFRRGGAPVLEVGIAGLLSTLVGVIAFLAVTAGSPGAIVEPSGWIVARWVLLGVPASAVLVAVFLSFLEAAEFPDWISVPLVASFLALEGLGGGWIYIAASGAAYLVFATQYRLTRNATGVLFALWFQSILSWGPMLARSLR